MKSMRTVGERILEHVCYLKEQQVFSEYQVFMAVFPQARLQVDSSQEVRTFYS
jgi:hypothetical protein